MPAYGKNLSPAEVTALVAFMQTFVPRTNPGAHGDSADHAGALRAGHGGSGCSGDLAL